MKTFLYFWIIIVAHLNLAGCAKEPVKLVYVIPNDFEGIVKMRSGSRSGVELMEHNGIIKLMFPMSGTLEIEGELPTHQWHQSFAHFEDGTYIPVPGPDVIVPDDVVALRRIGTRNDNTESWYFVGTSKMKESVMNKE